MEVWRVYFKYTLSHNSDYTFPNLRYVIKAITELKRSIRQAWICTCKEDYIVLLVLANRTSSALCLCRWCYSREEASEPRLNWKIRIRYDTWTMQRIKTPLNDFR